jgi:hypothetical protein
MDAVIADPLILSVDLDGVLVNFRAGFCQLAQAQLGVAIPEEATTWDWYRPFLTADHAQTLFAYVRITPGFWAGLPEEPDADAAASLGRLSKAAQTGHVVYFMTQRPKTAWQATVRWLRACGWTFGTPMVLLVGEEGKGSVCDGLDVTHAIDDRIEHLQSIAETGAAVACVTRPYNVGFEWPYRVDHLPQWLDDLGL